MRLTARFADIWNRDFDAVTPGYEPYSREDLLASQERVDAACVELGRDPATLKRTAGIWVDLPNAPSRGWNALTGTPEEMAAGLRKYADAGYTAVQAWFQPGTVERVEGFAPVLDLLDRG